MSIDNGRLFSQLESMREDADYNCCFEVSEEFLVKKIEPTRQFINTIETLIAQMSIKNNNTINNKEH